MRVLLLSALPLLAGCSTFGQYLQRPNNYESLPQDLGPGDVEPAVASLSVDASRRLIMSQRYPQRPDLLTNRVTCSEPPPDAALAILAKTAVEASAKRDTIGEASGKLSDEFATSVVALARRTTNVELWRTTSATYCNLLMNGWTDAATIYLAMAPQFAIKSDDPAPEQKPPKTKEEQATSARKEVSASEEALVTSNEQKRLAEAKLEVAKTGADPDATKAAEREVAQSKLRVIESEIRLNQARKKLAALPAD